MWEQRYDILKPDRSITNIRNYSDADLKTLLNISLLNSRGMKISKLAEMSKDEIQQHVISMWDCCEEFECQVNALSLAMIDLDEDRFEKIISRNFLQLGFEQTMLKIIYPFFTKIGLLWQACCINPAQEHFITHLVRRKMMVAIDGQIIPKDPDCPGFLLFLPEGEYHETGLLFAHFLLRERNCRSIYLGQSVPLSDLVSTSETYKTCHIFTVFTSGWTEDNISKSVSEISAALPSVTFLIAGAVSYEVRAKLPSNARFLAGIPELVKYVDSLCETLKA